MADEDNGAALTRHLVHLAQAFLLELGIADGENLIHDEDFRLHVGGDGEGEPYIHAAGIVFDRGIEEFADPGKFDNGVEAFGDISLLHPQHRPVEEDVFPAGQFRVEAGADFQQAADVAVHVHRPFCGISDAGKDLEDGAFAGAVFADQPHYFAFLHLEGDIFQGPEVFPVGGGVGGGTAWAQPFKRRPDDMRHGVTHSFIADRFADAVAFAQFLYFNSNVRHNKINSKFKTPNTK